MLARSILEKIVSLASLIQRRGHRSSSTFKSAVIREGVGIPAESMGRNITANAILLATLYNYRG